MSAAATMDPLFTVQREVCYYPTSDLYARSPRYLYYALLVLSFITPRHGWLAHIFLGGAATYAATAAIQVFVLTAAPTPTMPLQIVSIPYISSDAIPSNFTGIGDGIQALVTDTDFVEVQPDFLELDLDAILAVVVTAYLVGLPLQCWSRTARSSRILHLLVFAWNLLMLGGVICSLVIWPSINTASTQYRFCYSDAYDSDDLQNQGWQSEFWKGDWNSSVWQLFNSENSWERLSDNCFYPCFNTSQILRQETSLKAGIQSGNSPVAALHDPEMYSGDYFQPIVYSAVIAFSAAQVYLLVVSRFNICTRIPIHDLSRLWRDRYKILGSFALDIKVGSSIMYRVFRNTWARMRGRLPRKSSGFPVEFPHKHPAIRFLIDLLTLIVLVVSMIVGPATIVAFVAWIEWYIRHDGSPNEQPNQVGQWAPLVSVGVVLLAALAIRLRHRFASRGEMLREIEHAKQHVDQLERIYLEKIQRIEEAEQRKIDRREAEAEAQAEASKQ